MVCGRQHKRRFWNELCLDQVQAMTFWRSANKSFCVACDLGTEVVDETHTHTHTHIIGSLDPEFGQNCNRMCSKS
jgi:hypothetical protein